MNLMNTYYFVYYASGEKVLWINPPQKDVYIHCRESCSTKRSKLIPGVLRDLPSIKIEATSLEEAILAKDLLS